MHVVDFHRHGILHKLNSVETDPRLLARVREAEDPVAVVHPDVTIEPGVYLGNVHSIGEKAFLGYFAAVGHDVVIGNNVSVANDTAIANGVVLTPGLRVRKHAIFGTGAQVAAPTRENLRGNARTIEEGAVIGPSVILPSEVQIGELAVVPVTDAVGQIGPFGRFNRMVTVYGDLGGEPLYSVGCQFGITAEEFNSRVAHNTETTPESAQAYQARMADIQAMGNDVQAAFEDNRATAVQLLAIREMLTDMAPERRYDYIARSSI